MKLNISFRKIPKTKADTAVICVSLKNKLSPAAEVVDHDHEGFISYHLKNQEKFKGKKGQFLTISAPKDSAYARFVLVGKGDLEQMKTEDWEVLGGKLFVNLSSVGSVQVHFFAENEVSATHMAMGLKLRSYKFDKYKNRALEEDETEGALKSFEVILEAQNQAKTLFGALDAVSEGMFWARDLVNEPPNMLYPDSFAKMIKEHLQPLGVDVDILDEKKMLKLGFHAALAVGMGSIRPPRIVIMRWNGVGKKTGQSKDQNAPLAFVGKGVTFDTGGINIKPTGGIEEMKLDMGGAAAVVGLMKSLALRQSKSHAVGIVGLVENMPSHMAYRPSDIISSMAGKTIEVLNTDAEGRLVLADCLTYAQHTYHPRLMIDLATLTGAMMVALGSEYCGTFVNQDDLWEKLDSASKESGEKLWRMPLDEAFKKDVISKIADIQNMGNMGRYAGACTAAGFLEHFIENDCPWAHMDIAGTAWIKSDRPNCVKPATGFGVRVLDRFVAMHYE